MFKELVSEYGQRLPEHSKPAARDVLTRLLKLGHDYETLYWMIWNLGDRDLIKNQRLLFYKGYQDEVEKIKQQARKLNNNYEFDIHDIMKTFKRFCKYNNNEEISDYEFRYFMYGIEDFNKEEIEDIKFLYKKYFIKETLSITKKSMNKVRDGVIQELKNIKLFVDYNTIPYHFYA